MALTLSACAGIPPSRSYTLYSDKLDETFQLSRYRGDLSDSDIALLDGKITYCQFATLQKAQIIASTDHAAPLRHEMIAMMAAENYSNPAGVANGPYSNLQFGSAGSSGAWSTGPQGGGHH